MNKLQWNFNQNTKLFIEENASHNIVCEMATILSKGRWVNTMVADYLVMQGTRASTWHGTGLAWNIPLSLWEVLIWHVKSLYTRKTRIFFFFLTLTHTPHSHFYGVVLGTIADVLELYIFVLMHHSDLGETGHDVSDARMTWQWLLPWQ